MPEELIIAIALLIGAIWLLVKICQGIAIFVDSASKDLGAGVDKWKKNRYLKKRERLRPFVHTVIPNELDTFQKRLEAKESEVERAQRSTNWVALPPSWRWEKFQPVAPPCQRDSYAQMGTEDIESILCPNSDTSTWSAKESVIIGCSCGYPALPPANEHDTYESVATLSAPLQTASFEVDTALVSQKKVARYLSDEQASVLAYNNRRADLTARAARLNATVEEWNRKNRTSWESYVAESQRLALAELAAFQHEVEVYVQACRDERNRFNRLLDGYKKGEKQSVLERLGYVLDRITLPGSVPHIWDIDFDEEQKIVVVEIGLPDVVHQPPSKTVILKSGAVRKPLNQTERREFIPKIHPAILLRTAYEIFRNDVGETIALLVLNGWVKFDDPGTGVNSKAYTASLMVERERINPLNLAKIDPLVAFQHLNGKSAGKLIEIIPIEPVLSLNRKDSRFVNAKEVLSGLGPETNLAAMDWQDFEHLIRELFEKEFSGRGAEVKITQASRDRGVDAVVFDPDPIHGGKYVIQAKRYTNTVDVSSVRDLCAVVHKEGASRGILVTTSTYGADAYAFANNEPVTLLNGAELLGLLKRHGYTFRINLQEARRLI